MTQPNQRRIRQLTRQELYELVWKTPMTRLGEEFGISGNGLAKICDRMDIPCPPRGYWAKKEAGKPVQTLPLPPQKEGTRRAATIRPTVPPQHKSPPQAGAAQLKAQTAAAAVRVPDTTEKLHPMVQAWFAVHRRQQKERAADKRKASRSAFDWSFPLLDDLTERDLYRFRVTSAVFRAVEAAGGQVVSAPVTGKVTFRTDGEEIDCSIVEKLYRPLRKPEGEAAKWTAWPDHHQTGLHSTGFLRVTINTYIEGIRKEWVETEASKIGDSLPEIAGAIIAAGTYRKRRKEELRVAELRRQEEMRQREEVQRLRKIEEQRWDAFREATAAWQEHARLSALLAQLRQRLEAEGDSMVEDRLLSEWIAWAQQRTDTLDPLSGGLSGLFGKISK